MRIAYLKPLLAALTILALCPAALAGDDKIANARETIKQDAREVGQTISRDSKEVGHAVAQKSKQVGHAVADGARTVGTTVKQESKKVGAAVTSHKTDNPK